MTSESHPQAREGKVGRPICDGASDEPRTVGAEAAHRRDGQVAGRGQLGRHPKDGLARRLLRLHAAHLPPLLRRLHPPRRHLRHARVGRQE